MEERRRELRHRVGAPVMLRRADGTLVQGKAVNVSGSGVLVETEGAVGLAVGEEVFCDVGPIECEGDAVPAWGTGRVRRCEDNHIAVQFGVATF